MILFHGSDSSIDEINLGRCKPFKDFGQGFYLTPSQKYSESMAEAVAIINGTKPVVNTFFFIIDQTIEDVRIKVFGKPNKEWADFVIKNRTNNFYSHRYDIVVGPVLREGGAVLFRKYLDGLIDIQTLIEKIKIGDYSIQYCFCTDKAIRKLRKA